MIKFLVNQRLRMLHGDRGGQSIIFVALVLFTLVSFMALVINVGHRTSEKVEIQLGTDAAALSGGTWIARGLNTIAILNVTMTEILAWIIFLQAFKTTHTTAKITVIANIVAAGALCAFPFTAAFGCPWQTYLNSVAQPYINILGKAAKQVPKIVKNLWKFMKFCRKAEDVVKVSSGAMSELSAINVANQNISNLGLLSTALFPVGTMPTKEGIFKDICDRTHDGGPGYDNFFGGIAPINMRFLGMPIQAWFALVWLPPSGMIPPPAGMYPLFVLLESNSLCPGKGQSSAKIEKFTMSCSECDNNGFKMVNGKRVKVPGKSKWQGGVFEVINKNKSPNKTTGLVSGNLITVGGKRVNGRDFGKSNFTGGSPSIRGKSTVTDRPALYPHSWCRSYSSGRCNTYSIPDKNTRPNGVTVRTTSVVVSTTQGGRKTEYSKSNNTPCTVTQYYQAHRVYYVFLRENTIPHYDNANPPNWTYNTYEQIWEQRKEFRYYKEQWSMTECKYEEEKTSKPQNTSKRPKPLVLSDNWEDETNYLALVFKNVEDQFTLGSATGGGNEKGNLAMAQVKIYNASGEDDLFNQDWHARLAPVNLSKVNLSFGPIKVPIPRKFKNLISNFAGTMVVH